MAINHVESDSLWGAIHPVWARIVCIRFQGVKSHQSFRRGEVRQLREAQARQEEEGGKQVPHVIGLVPCNLRIALRHGGAAFVSVRAVDSGTLGRRAWSGFHPAGAFRVVWAR